MLRAAGRRILGFGLGRRARVSVASERGPITCDLRDRERRDEKMLRAAGRRILGFGLGQRARVSAAAGYHERVGDHFENSRNVGSIDENDPSAGTALIDEHMKIQIKVDDATEKIVDVFYENFDCHDARVTVSMVIEWLKGKHVDEALSLYSKEVAKSLNIDLEKDDCIGLLFSAIELAAKDYKAKKVRQQLEILRKIEPLLLRLHESLDKNK